MSGIIAQNSGRHTGLVKASSGGGVWNLIETQTASSDSTLDFTSGIDSTYDEYVFKFINIHPSASRPTFSFQADTGTNTNYNITATTTYYSAYHTEADATGFGYDTPHDEAQSTSFLQLSVVQCADNDASNSGYLHIFNPSSSVFVKHFITLNQAMAEDGGGTKYSYANYKAGYFNTTTALTRFQFKMSTGNIDAGDICLYGITT